MPFQRPAYPESLKKTDWDRKKGVIAKAHGRTGVGEQMQVCERAYADVSWDKLELTTLPCARVNSFTRGDWQRALDEAKSELNGKLRKFVESLYKLRDVANKAGDAFKNSKTIPSSSTDHVRAIAKTADHLGVSLNANSLGNVLTADSNAVLKRIQEFADNTPGILKSVLQKTPAVIQDLRRDPSVKNFNDKAPKAARNITQNLTNLVLFMDKRGVLITGITNSELPQLKKLSDTFVRWGNSSGQFLPANSKAELVTDEIDKFEDAYLELVSVMR